jgi:hypothetical protein
VGVIFEHLDHRSPRYVSSMTRHYREEDFLFLAEVDHTIHLTNYEPTRT